MILINDERTNTKNIIEIANKEKEGILKKISNKDSIYYNIFDNSFLSDSYRFDSILRIDTNLFRSLDFWGEFKEKLYERISEYYLYIFSLTTHPNTEVENINLAIFNKISILDLLENSFKPELLIFYFNKNIFSFLREEVVDIIVERIPVIDAIESLPEYAYNTSIELITFEPYLNKATKFADLNKAKKNLENFNRKDYPENHIHYNYTILKMYITVLDYCNEEYTLNDYAKEIISNYK